MLLQGQPVKMQSKINKVEPLMLLLLTSVIISSLQGNEAASTNLGHLNASIHEESEQTLSKFHMYCKGKPLEVDQCNSIISCIGQISTCLDKGASESECQEKRKCLDELQLQSYQDIQEEKTLVYILSLLLLYCFVINFFRINEN